MVRIIKNKQNISKYEAIIISMEKNGKIKRLNLII